MKMASFFVFANLILLNATVASAINQSSSLDVLENKLLATNPQIRALESKVKAQKATTQSQIGNFLPQVSVTGGYSSNKTIQEPSEGYLGYISGTWNLFKGGEDYYLKTISSKEYRIAQLDLDVKTRFLRRQLREVYYALLANKKNLNLLDEKTEILKKQRQMAQKKINAGLTSGVDGIEIDLEENSIISERESVQTEITRLNMELSALLDFEVGDEAVPSNENFLPAQTDVNTDQAIQNNPSVKRQAELEEISHERASQQRSEFLPTLDLEANYGRITPEYSDPTKGTESKVALLLTWNLFSGMSSYYRSQSASAEITTQNFEKKNTYLEIKKDLQNLLTTNKNLVSLKTYQQQRLTFAQKYYDMTLSEYKRGIKNAPDLQTATASLFDAKRKMLELDRDISIVNAKINELI